MPSRPLSRRQRTGIPEVDALLAEIFDLIAPTHEDLYSEIVAAAVRLGSDSLDRGDLKIVLGALRELRQTFKIFASYPGRRVSVFGSARSKRHTGQYQYAQLFGAEMARHGWMTITGAGPGIMQAANEGAGTEHSFGLNIRLPFEQRANPILEGDEKLLSYRYFFTRKLAFVKEAHAFALFPGGFGTMDECFELLTLVQTGKSNIYPIVLIETGEDRYWERFVAFLREELLADGYISAEDLDLFCVVDNIDAAVTEILSFYQNYQSQRYIGKKLYLRLRVAPTPRELMALNIEFADIVAEGKIEVVPPHKEEITANGAVDLQDLHRLAFVFDRQSIGRLRHLIDRLNEFV